MSPPHASKEARKEQILKAAVACFARKSYHLTTMDDIVAESGLSKGSLYWHYKNKKDLFLSMLIWYFEQMGVGLKAMFSQPTLSAAEKLALLPEFSAQLAADPELEAMMTVVIDFYTQTHHDPAVNVVAKETLHPFINTFADIINEGIAAGEFKPVNARQLAVSLMAAYDGLFMYQMMLGDDFDWAETGRQLMQTLLDGLQTKD